MKRVFFFLCTIAISGGQRDDQADSGFGISA